MDTFKNTLYISDLDGTLLNQSATLSQDTIDGINALTKKGVHFGCATARTQATVSPILKDVTLSAPAVLMNGVVIYDLLKKEYVKIEYLGAAAFTEILKQIDERDLATFVYSVHNGQMMTYYNHLSNPAMTHFHDERVTLYQKPFTRLDNFHGLDKQEVIYALLIDKKEVLEPLYQSILSLKDSLSIDTCFYLDVYYDDIYCLEIFSNRASKYNAVKYLRDTYHYDHIVGFGDNLNDLALFKACDEAYAVANARDEVRSAATGVIESNLNNGVVHFIEDRIADQ